MGRRKTPRHLVRARTFRRARRPSADVRQHERTIVGNPPVQTGPSRSRPESSRRRCASGWTDWLRFTIPLSRLSARSRSLGQEDGSGGRLDVRAGGAPREALKKPSSAVFAVRLIRQLVPALAALQQHGPGIAHGALDVPIASSSAADGRLMIREHMVGSALGSLELSAARLWGQFGILARHSFPAAPTLDGRPTSRNWRSSSCR